jgi:hypothetical protein
LLFAADSCVRQKWIAYQQTSILLLLIMAKHLQTIAIASTPITAAAIPLTALHLAI